MRAIRLVVAVVLAMSLTVLPMSAGMAKMHVATAEMGVDTSGNSCPCCDAAHKCATGMCMLNCYNVPAISVEGLPLTQPLRERFVALGAPVPAPFSRRPDPPPPRL
jgi:hypothetical protein